MGERPRAFVFAPDLILTVTIEAVDPRGAGDSMTGGLAAGLARGRSLPDALRLGAAAGGLNVTRRGLASGDRREIERLAEHIDLRPARSAETADRRADRRPDQQGGWSR